MTTFPPIVNATLTRVQTAGGAEDYSTTARPARTSGPARRRSS
jgi:hypothetical protein